LWDKAIEIAKKNSYWSPGMMIIRSEVFNKKGEIKNYSETWIKLRSEDDKPVFETIKVIEDGKDITEEYKKEEHERIKQSNESQDKNSNSISSNTDCALFNPDEQYHLSLKLLTKNEIILGMGCFVYKFTKKRKEKFFTGKVWLEKETCIPLYVQYTSKPLEKGVKEMITTIYYNSESEEEWFIKKTVIETTVGFLIFKARFRCIIQFKEYYKKE
jgi:hypothetical protein